MVGQPTATNVIVPYIQMYQAGLAPEGGRWAYSCCWGPREPGKTKTVEALADVLHGSEKNVLKVDCGEFQMEHEVAKLIGAPPGYLGHRETQPMLTQQKLNGVTSEKCSLSLVLFDEIEKAAPSMTRLLLGVLDKGILRLGDNSIGQFRKEPGVPHQQPGRARNDARDQPGFRFPIGAAGRSAPISPASCRTSPWWPCASASRRSSSTASIASSPTSRSPRNRSPPSSTSRSPICRITSTRGSAHRSFTLEVPFEARQFLLQKGTSAEYGARELNRTIHRNLTQPLATLVATSQVNPGARVRVDLVPGGESLRIHCVESEDAQAPAHPTVLLVDDNRDLLHFLERLMADAGWNLVTAESATEARKVVATAKPNAALLDYMLPDGNGVELGVEFLQSQPAMLVIMMTGTILPPEEEALCEEHNFPVLRKPFLASDVMNQIRSRLAPANEAVRSA